MSITASELQRAASEVIADPSKTFSTLMHKQESVEISPCIPVSSHGLPACPLPGFSGFNNCSINFSFNYGSTKE